MLSGGPKSLGHCLACPTIRARPPRPIAVKAGRPPLLPAPASGVAGADPWRARRQIAHRSRSRSAPCEVPLGGPCARLGSLVGNRRTRSAKASGSGSLRTRSKWPCNPVRSADATDAFSMVRLLTRPSVRPYGPCKLAATVWRAAAARAGRLLHGRPRSVLRALLRIGLGQVLSDAQSHHLIALT
jgi:hypothetical protein